MDNLMAIAVMEARHAVDPAESLEDRFRAAMGKTWRHWVCTNENDQLTAACEAVYASASEDEQARIREELRALQTLNAMLSGVPVDLDRFDPPENPIGINKLWQEVKAARA